MNQLATKQIHIIGGGTVSHVRSHLALAAPAYGTTAKELLGLCRVQFPSMDINLHLTKMADAQSKLETFRDLELLVNNLIDDLRTKIIFFNSAVVDFEGDIAGVESGKYQTRLSSA